MDVKLTSYSHGAGCGCKISPAVLNAILSQTQAGGYFPNLLVGNEERDDAAVLDLGDGTALISTTDFFMPIVDDPFLFGKIAAVNAISDVYAMGGQPLLAIAILAWPVDKLAPNIAGAVLEGGRAACAEAGIPLAGGHSIDAPEPIFGLAVSGRVAITHLKKNGGGKAGDLLYLTKPLGVGILTTAQKKDKLKPDHEALAIYSMTQLNAIGAQLGSYEWVHAMSDVTGFGLLGHLSEMCAASGTSAVVQCERVPVLHPAILDFYLPENCVPGGTHRNFESYGSRISPMNEQQKLLLCDPQTSGGLLLAVDPYAQQIIEDFLSANDIEAQSIGRLTAPEADHLIAVI